MGFISKAALKRAGFFPPRTAIEQFAYYIYQITTIFLLIYLFSTNIKFNTIFIFPGFIIFIIGTVLYTKSIIDFAKPQTNGINKKGLYQYSRNPMYLAFFLYFLGCSILISSWIYFAILIIFQISIHYLILSEERWCSNKFGKEYKAYMKKVRRYI